MKTASELYPRHAEEEREYGSFYGPGDYQPILDELGEILLQTDDSDYQGDSRILYQNGRRVGWLQFGWGSCSGCDSLQACTNIEQIQQLMDSLRDEVRWFDNSDDALSFFETHDWSGDYSWHCTEQQVFVEESIKILKAVFS